MEPLSRFDLLHFDKIESYQTEHNPEHWMQDRRICFLERSVIDCINRFHQLVPRFAEWEDSMTKEFYLLRFQSCHPFLRQWSLLNPTYRQVLSMWLYSIDFGC